MADDPQRVVKWLKRHVREPLDTYFAYADASVQDIKAAARAAGFTGTTSQGALLTYWTFKSRSKSFTTKIYAKAVIGDKGDIGSDAIGTLHVAHFVGFENNHLGFFTIFDGDFAKYIQDFADKNALVFDTLFPHIDRRAADPGRKERQGVLAVGAGQQPAGHRLLLRLSGPLGPRHSRPPGRSNGGVGEPLMAVAPQPSRTRDCFRSRRAEGTTRHRRKTTGLASPNLAVVLPMNP